MSKCYASAVLAIAAAEIGYHEKKSNSQLDNPTANAGSANYTKYARDFDEKYPKWSQRQEKRLRMVRYVRRLVYADRLRICGRAAPALPA